MAQDRFGGRHRRGNPVGCVELHVRHTHRHAFNRGCYRNFHLVIDPLIHTDMVKKTKQNGSAAMQVLRGGGKIFEYMVEVYINGNFTSFRRLYHELNKKTRKDAQRLSANRGFGVGILTFSLLLPLWLSGRITLHTTTYPILRYTLNSR